MIFIDLIECFINGNDWKILGWSWLWLWLSRLFYFNEILQKANEKYSKEKAAEYYLKNKEIIKEKARERYKNLSQEEKDKIKEYQKKMYQELVQYKKEALNNKWVLFWLV